ncbi:MAG: hypothetical protein ACJ70N_00535 [Nitrososphaera sp.]
MTYLKNTKKNKDNNNNSNRVTATTTISVLTLAIIIMMVAPTSIDTPVAAQQVTTTRAAGGNTTTASSSTSPSGIDLSSSQPVYQERSPPGGLTPINETHGILTFSGNGTITLPNSTQAINTTSNGTGIISFATTSGYAKETIRAENGETVTATTYEIVRFNNPAAAPQGGGKGIVTAVFQTNSTGTLAPLNGMILAGIDNLSSSGESHVTLWRWESGITNTTSASVTRSSNNSTGMSAVTPSAIT